MELAMNTKNLHLIFDHYIDKFETLDEEESYKWEAVHDFQETFDLEASDFAKMLEETRKVTRNLIDSYMQPLKGLVTMAEKCDEAETIREMFRKLFVDDQNDLQVRQEKIDEFLASCDELLEKHYPESHIYQNDQRSVMAYLWFHDPNNHYLCKNTEAKDMAKAIEFYENWGTYAEFDLEIFHKFCDIIVEEIKEHEELVEVHNTRFEGHEDEMHPDENYHILAFDIIYCASNYDLYNNVRIKNVTAKERRKILANRKEANKRAEKLGEMSEKKMMLEEAVEAARSFIKKDMTLIHTKYGEGKLQKFEDRYLIVKFPGIKKPKKFEIKSAFGKGFLTIESDEFQSFMDDYGEILGKASTIKRKHRRAEKKLEKYEDYID